MKTEPSHVNTVQAKNELNALVEQTRQSKQPIIIEKRGEPVAVLWGYEEFRNRAKTTTEDNASASLVREIRAFHKIQKKKFPQPSTDSVDILRQLRTERNA